MRQYTYNELSNLIGQHERISSVNTFYGTVGIFLSKHSIAFYDILKNGNDFLCHLILEKVFTYGKDTSFYTCFISVDKCQTPELFIRITLFKGNCVTFFYDFHTFKISVTEFEQKSIEEQKFLKSREVL